MKNLKKKLIVAILVFSSFSVFAQLERVQAAFIFNFTKYMEWPSEDRNGDFIIGVINSSEMISALNTMVSGKLVGMQKISVQSFNSISGIKKCHIVYLPSNKSSDIGSLVSKISGQRTIIITNAEGLAKKGADINFIILNKKQNFELNKNNIKKKNITISSRLEDLAAKVY